jgi:hypothetical protein
MGDLVASVSVNGVLVLVDDGFDLVIIDLGRCVCVYVCVDDGFDLVIMDLGRFGFSGFLDSICVCVCARVRALTLPTMVALSSVMGV